MKKLLITLILAILANATTDTLPLHLLPHGCLEGQKAAKSHGHHGGGMKTAMYQLVGFTGSMDANVTYYQSNLEEKPLQMEANMINLPRSMYNNYHALVANAIKDNDHYSAVYYLYKHGKPSQTSPALLTSKQKSDFEIIPNQLPREHDRYYGSKKYDFILKFQNQPLENQIITLTTLLGTEQKVKTDTKGQFSISLPNDFKNVQVGRRANQPSYFILSSSFSQNNTNYHTTFANPYHVNSTDYWNSIPAGVGVMGIGLCFGLLLLWRRNNG